MAEQTKCCSRMKHCNRLCQKVNFHFPSWKDDVRHTTTSQRVGENLDVGFYSNTKVSLTFSALRWLLILVIFLGAVYGTARPVDIYKLICLRAMAFYKEKHLHMFHQSLVSTAQHVIALNKHQSTFARRESCFLTLCFKVSKYSITWKLLQQRHRAAGRSHKLDFRLVWLHHLIAYHQREPPAQVCPHHADEDSG